MILLFPGQGSQYQGMGQDLYDNFKVAQLIFEEVNDSLGYNLSEIIFNGPTEKLNSTEVTQPAIMAVSLAVVRIIEQELGKKITDAAHYVMGHSLGEYSALCAANSIDIGNTAKILQIRGKAMQEAVTINQGTMLALLGAKMELVEKVVNEIDGCEIANDNGGEQIVLSCLTNKIEEVKERIKSAQIKRVVQLPVSGPFHSSFMQLAADKMQEVITNLNMKKPSIPLISNVTASPITEVEQIKKGLVKQITATVRWRESLLYCMNQQHKDYVELGPGNVLSNLIKRSRESNSATNIGNTQEIKRFLQSID